MLTFLPSQPLSLQMSYQVPNANRNYYHATARSLPAQGTVERFCRIAFRSSVPTTVRSNALIGFLGFGNLGLQGGCVLVDPLQLREMAIQNPNDV